MSRLASLPWSYLHLTPIFRRGNFEWETGRLHPPFPYFVKDTWWCSKNPTSIFLYYTSVFIKLRILVNQKYVLHSRSSCAQPTCIVYCLRCIHQAIYFHTPPGFCIFKTISKCHLEIMKYRQITPPPFFPFSHESLKLYVCSVYCFLLLGRLVCF